MSTPRVVGLDLSLSSTGIATSTQVVTAGYSLTKDASDVDRCKRIDAIRDAVMLHVDTIRDHGTHYPLVVVEGFSFGSPQGATEAGGLGWAIRLELWRRGVPFAVVAPPTLKKFATGKGNAGKDDMKLAALQRFGLTFTGTGSGDRCDARWLQEMGLHHLGAPTVDLPAVHLEAMAKVSWPVVAS